MKFSIFCIFSIGMISSGNNWILINDIILLVKIQSSVFDLLFIYFKAMAIKCYSGASDDAKEPQLKTCDPIYDVCAKITTKIGTKKVFCMVNNDYNIVEDCKTSEASKCYCNKDQCNQFIEETTTVKATTKQAILEDTTQHVKETKIDDNENLRSEISSIESLSNAATTIDKVNEFSIDL